jgi:hypothetical protein
LILKEQQQMRDWSAAFVKSIGFMDKKRSNLLVVNLLHLPPALLGRNEG